MGAAAAAANERPPEVPLRRLRVRLEWPPILWALSRYKSAQSEWAVFPGIRSIRAMFVGANE